MTEYAILHPTTEESSATRRRRRRCCCCYTAQPERHLSLLVLLLLLVVVVLLVLFFYGVLFSKKKILHTVLVIVDMQNDYCIECNSTTVSRWALAGLPGVARHINLLHSDPFFKQNIDRVIFTQDWLSATSKYLKRNTYGAALIRSLDRPEGSLAFTKSSDDWMNRLGPKYNCTYCDASFDDKYHFALNGERRKGEPERRPSVPGLPPILPPTLDQYLTSYGYSPRDTRLVVTGIAENRCVMKGSVHAMNLGYKDVILYLPGTGAKNVTKKENWIPHVNAPENSCELTLGVATCTEEQEEQWRVQVYKGHKGGPTSADAQVSF